MTMHQWFARKQFFYGPLDIPMRDPADATELENQIKQAESNGLTYTRRFIVADDIDTESKGSGDPAKLKHTALVTASTDSVDRDQEVILQKGIDRKLFRKNPVVLYANDSTANPPLGYSLWEKTDTDASGRNSLKAMLKFADRPEDWPPVGWFPDEIFELVKQKVIRGISIGFLPLDARPPHEKEIEANPSLAAAKRIITKASLLEISVVPIGANQDALIETVNKGLIAADVAKGYGFTLPEAWTWETADVLVTPKQPTRLDVLTKMKSGLHK